MRKFIARLVQSWHAHEFQLMRVKMIPTNKGDYLYSYWQCEHCGRKQFKVAQPRKEEDA